MATTKLWHIKGRLRDLIEYVENPAKTADPSMQDFFNVFSYTQNPDKTDGGEFITAINCVKEIALEQMILTKKNSGKERQRSQPRSPSCVNAEKWPSISRNVPLTSIP